jgi:Acetyltransferase (isoleucine patch superfamily)
MRPGVCLACSGHAIDPKQRSHGMGTSAPITLEENVWIGANSTVCGGVTNRGRRGYRDGKRRHS